LLVKVSGSSLTLFPSERKRKRERERGKEEIQERRRSENGEHVLILNEKKKMKTFFFSNESIQDLIFVY